jgi:predicted porin
MRASLLAGAVTAAFCQAACAQSSVELYGIIDSGIVIGRGNPKGSELKLEGGVSNGSRLGFRGREDLGGGASAIFVMESGLLNDTGALDQGGLQFGRQSWVGVQSESGSVTLGRQYTPIYTTLLMADPFGNNYGGASGQLMSGEKAGVRMNNTLMYSSPVIGGFNAQLAYGFGEVPGELAKSRQLGAAFGYANGPVSVRLGFNHQNNATATDAARNTLLAAKYDFGPAIATLGYGVNRGLGAIDSRDILIGMTVPFGAHTLMASYIRKQDASPSHAADAHQLAMAYTYALSKRTAAYAAIAGLSNTHFTTTKFAGGSRELDLGIRTSF